MVYVYHVVSGKKLSNNSYYSKSDPLKNAKSERAIHLALIKDAFLQSMLSPQSVKTDNGAVTLAQ